MNSKKKFAIFDAAEVELTKTVNLIEASAGTGKTYAITMLVLRSLVELEVPIEEILVVTFTKAATEELKLRIRTRIVQARDLLAGKSMKSDDATLVAWAEKVASREKSSALLQLALYDIDRAGVFTIHGFCQRMLVEQALESGQLFDVELLSDVDHIRRQLADDFWRSHIYTLSSTPCLFFMEKFPDPEKLLDSVRAVFQLTGQIVPSVESMEKALARLDDAMDKMTVWYREYGAVLHEQFLRAVLEGCFKKVLKENFDRWWQTLERFFMLGSDELPENICFLGRLGLMDALNGNKFRGDHKKQNFISSLPLPDQEIEELLAAAKNLCLTVRVNLAGKLREEVSLRLERQGSMGFNDLILRLAHGLDGEKGRALKRKLGERFKVALIDEFQDTDAVQYHIFSRIFGENSHYLYLIGDPKQAIYKFRGADIHAYFLARDSAGKLLTLDTNYRSHPALVKEVNRLFSSRENPFYLDEQILAYHPVKAGKSSGEAELIAEEKSLAGMVYCYLPADREDKKGRWTSSKAAIEFIGFVIHEIGRLLHNENRAVLQDQDSRFLKPSDIAILVRSHSQAQSYKNALIDSGIPAVVGSNQSVFWTDECRELCMLVRAIASPQDIALIKNAMTISWFGFTGNALHDLWQDDDLFSSWQDRLLEYNRIWKERGFLVMMNRLLLQENVFVTLARTISAERIIANIQHLLELTQDQESCEKYGVNQTQQWLRRMQEDKSKYDNVELLLESDEEAVRIVTMHGSKGLEYPVVFCPYLWYRTNRLKNEKQQIACHGDRHRSIIDLGSEFFAEHRARAEEEEMAEELRLLYVALTRARVRCYIFWADVKAHGVLTDSFQSSLGYLLFPEGQVGSDLQHKMFSQCAEKNSVEFIELSLVGYPAHFRHAAEKLFLRPLPESERSLYTDWQMSSYSAMAALSEYEHEKAYIGQVGGELPRIAVPGLPAGPRFGNLIHDLLETVSFSAISRREDYQDVLQQKCKRYAITADSADIQKLLEIAVTTCLPVSGRNQAEVNGFSLCRLPEERCLKEMDFYFHLNQLATGQINEILADEPTVTPLAHRMMKGYLTGFVDLVCLHREKYYILDYKTNFLGESMADYVHGSLVSAMQSHNYGLQYWIYTLVLHRHLQNVIPGYSYEKHFGGVLYLFLRGMSPAVAGNGVYYTLPSYHILTELDLAIGGR